MKFGMIFTIWVLCLDILHFHCSYTQILKFPFTVVFHHIHLTYLLIIY